MEAPCVAVVPILTSYMKGSIVMETVMCVVLTLFAAVVFSVVVVVELVGGVLRTLLNKLFG